MKQLAVLALIFALAGCSGGVSDEFTLAECEAFTTKWLDYSKMSDMVPPEQMAEFRQGLPGECMSKKMGLSREELDCGVKASNLDEFRACGIVIQG